jgi:GTP-binding protein
MATPRLVEAEFMKSAQALGDSVGDTVSEVVFLGRSNVGKSSSINGLTSRKNLAKSSATPGKTQLINFFDIRYIYDEKDWGIRFVDLPGFGYAKVSKDLKGVWQKNLVEFIKHRVSIRVFIHLRDARHPNAEIDTGVNDYVKKFIRGDQLYLDVFTKIDKLNMKEKRALKKKFPGCITISNSKRDGYDRIHQKIFEHIFGIEEWSN